MGQLKRIGLVCLLLLWPRPLFSQQLGKDWGQAAAHVGWASAGEAVVHDGRIWIFAWPAFPTPRSSEVWYSSDGATWTSATLSAPWHDRVGFTPLAFDGRIWIFGGSYEIQGSHGVGFLNDVWYSSDGVKWTSASLSAPWGPRTGHTSVVFGGKMWVIGGHIAQSPYCKNDVWCSLDGVAWTSATLSALWAPRGSHASVVFDGKIWVIGGLDDTFHYKNDVWCSSDGVTWTSATLSAAWAPRYSHASVVHEGRVWVMGGGVLDQPWNNDVWYSSDGAYWTSATLSATWPPRAGQAAVVYDDRIWIMGGTYGYMPRIGDLNDVWYSPGLYSVGVRSWRLYP